MVTPRSSAVGGTRLARFINAPDGIDKDAALQAAEQRLQSIRPDAMNEIMARIERLDTLAIDADREISAERRIEILDASNAVYSVAGTFGGDFLSRVSHGLCHLLDHLIEFDRWDQAAVLVHVQAMQLTRSQSVLPRIEQERIIVGLERVREKALSA